MAGKKSTKSKRAAKGPSLQQSSDKCPNCSSRLPDSDRYCSTCRHDIGAPNVRSAGSQSERSALKSRFAEAKIRARSRKLEKSFNNCFDAVGKVSGVVVAMPASVARGLAEDPRKVYVNYETLVGAGIRRAAESQNDRHRCAVTGFLFGSYAPKIVYGVLSLNDQGLPTYGRVFCRLRNVAIQDRTSFLEENSFTFAKKHDLRLDSIIPEGYRAVWENRYQLVLAKICDSLTTAQGVLSWQRLLVRSDGKTQANDDFIEAHIYDSFDIASVEQMVVANTKGMSRDERLDAKLAMELFHKRA